MSLLFLSFVIAIAAIGLISVFFIVCRRYDDGYIGNLALGLPILIPCCVVLWEVHRGVWLRADPVLELLVIGFAIFLARHAYRFAMFHWKGKYGWRSHQHGAVDGV